MFKGEEIGLKDKNGQMIKEGDLVKESVYSKEDKKTFTAIYKVVYLPKYACFVFQSVKYKNQKLFFNEDTPYYKKDYEVINEK